MQVVLESPSALERQFTITIPTGDVETEFEAKLKETAKRVRIDGFRPGKVPASVVRQRYGQAIRQEIVSDLMEKSLGQALSEHQVNPVGSPKIEDVKFEEGQDFSFKATFEVFPELEPVLLDGKDVEQKACKISAADVKELITTLREQKKTWKESPRAAAKDGDRVTINFEGFVDGEAFDGGKAEEHALVLGTGTMIPGFEDGIIGMKKGESREIEVTFPEGYHAENLKGKVATFNIDVVKLERGDLPAVDEEFIKSFGVESGTEEDFKKELKEQMSRELSMTLKNMNKTAVFDALLDANADAPIPSAAVASEIQTLKHQAVERFGGGNHIDANSLPDDLFTEQAERRVRLGVLLGATVKQLEIKPDHDRVKALVDEMASAYDDPDQVVNFYYSKEENLRQVEALAIEEQVAEALLAKAKVSTIEMSYADVMKSRQA